MAVIDRTWGKLQFFKSDDEFTLWPEQKPVLEPTVIDHIDLVIGNLSLRILHDTVDVGGLSVRNRSQFVAQAEIEVTDLEISTSHPHRYCSSNPMKIP